MLNKQITWHKFKNLRSNVNKLYNMQHPVKTKTFDAPMRDYNYDHNFELGINVAITRIATLFLAE